MIRTIVTAIAATALTLLGAGIASAEVTSQSTSEVDHMASDTESSGPGSVLRIVGYHPVYDQDGNQVFRADGSPVLLPTLMSGPVDSGVPQAEVFHP